MRWLEWTPTDPHRLIGGVETHILSMARCMRECGIEVEFSSDPEVLFHGQGFDVVRTHGDLLPKKYLGLVRRGPLRIHTLHGSAVGQMCGLKQFHRGRHWKAFYREIVGCFRADLVTGVHGQLALMKGASQFGRSVLVIHNGWNAMISTKGPDSVLPADINERWAFIGRGWDPVKGGDRVLTALQSNPHVKLIVVPGEGIPDHPRVFKTGRLSSTQVFQVLQSSRGLLLPSRFEGLALVMLEALAAGVPVVASHVGGNPTVESCDVRGLSWFRDPDDSKLFVEDLERAQRENPTTEREARAEWNRSHIWTWEQCTDLLLQRVRLQLEMRKEA